MSEHVDLPPAPSDPLPFSFPSAVPDLTRELGLYVGEEFFRDHYYFLKNKGYQLRPRYHPDWVPSWRGGDFRPGVQEDRAAWTSPHVCDATRPDGTLVALKPLPQSEFSEEEEITLKLCSGSLLDDPRNHCVPIVELFTTPPRWIDDPPRRILVTPLLLPVDEPDWYTVGEAMECLRQIFEGIKFMHDHHTAHRDCNMRNIMMEPSMALEPYHPVRNDLRRDFMGPARFTTRTKRPPRYFLIDLGLSRTYDPAQGPALDLPVMGGDKTLPELKNYNSVCDPFPADVYYLGSWIDRHFIRNLTGFDFMRPLVVDMMKTVPAERPTIYEAVRRLDDIITTVGTWRLHSRVSRRDDPRYKVRERNLFHLFRRVHFALTRRSPLPTPPVDAKAKKKATASPVAGITPHTPDTAASADPTPYIHAPQESSGAATTAEFEQSIAHVLAQQNTAEKDTSEQHCDANVYSPIQQKAGSLVGCQCPPNTSTPAFFSRLLRSDRCPGL